MVQGRLRSASTKHFLRELKKLPARVRARILLAIEDIMSSHYAGLRLRGELDGLLRWRTGDYRIRKEEPGSQHIAVDGGFAC